MASLREREFVLAARTGGVRTPAILVRHIVPHVLPSVLVFSTLVSIVFATLLVFTGITVAAAFKNLGILNPIVALAIACTKGVVVILYFMHVKYQSKLVKLTVGAGFFTFLVLITMTLTDYVSRAWGLWS